MATSQAHVQTGIGDVEVQVPKVRDRSGSGIRFNSQELLSNLVYDHQAALLSD